MMRRRSFPLFALLSAFFLLFAQGSALAHWIEHVAADGQALVSQTDDTDGRHRPQDSAEHLCLSCLAFAGITAAPPLKISLLPERTAGDSLPPELDAGCVVSRCILPYGARAPPAAL